MPITFEIDKDTNTLIVRPTDLSHREFNAIWEADKTKDKREAHRHLIFVYHLCDMRSDCFEYAEKEKLKECKRNAYDDEAYAFKGNWQALVEAAIAKYEQLNENAPKRALATIDRKIDQFQGVLDETLPLLERKTIFDKDSGKKIEEIEPNIELVLKTADGIEKMQVTREKIEARIAKLPQSSKNRAGAVESLLESGRLGIKPMSNAD
jgi:hypothetical protein